MPVEMGALELMDNRAAVVVVAVVAVVANSQELMTAVAAAAVAAAAAMEVLQGMVELVVVRLMRYSYSTTV